MKRIVLLVIASLFLLLTACGKGNDSPLDWMGSFNSTERVDVISADESETLTSFSSKKELSTFVDSLILDEWNLAEIPADAAKGKTFKLYQGTTVTLFGVKESDHELKEVGKITTYEGLPYVTLSLLKFSLDFEVPEAVRQYLDQQGE